MVAGDIPGCPPGSGRRGGEGLCILCMKINLFSQYLYPAAAVRCPLPSSNVPRAMARRSRI